MIRVAALAVPAVTACSLDFTVRPDPGDAGAPFEAGAADGEARDATSDAEAPETGGPDADAGPDCTALANDVDAKRKAARACTLASGHCTTTVKNQCDCDVVVAVAGSAAVAAYQAAVEAFKSSGCFLGCTGSCAATTSKNCLQNGSDVLCFPDQ